MNSWPESNQVQVLVQNQPVLDTTLNGPFVQEFSFALPPGTAAGNKLTLEIKTTRLSAIAWVRATYAKTLGPRRQAGKSAFYLRAPCWCRIVCFPMERCAAQPFPPYTADGAVRRRPRVSNGTPFFCRCRMGARPYWCWRRKKISGQFLPFKRRNPPPRRRKALDYLIVTSAPFLQGAAQAYAAYGPARPEEGILPSLWNTPPCRIRFLMGYRHPLALKNYLAWLKTGIVL